MDKTKTCTMNFTNLTKEEQLTILASVAEAKGIVDALRDDYKQMQIGFIYTNAPSFDEIMERLSQLQNRFRALKNAADL